MSVPARSDMRRITVDLTREDHVFLRTYALAADAHMTDVLTALVTLLRDDEFMADRVNAMVARSETAR